MITRTTKDTKNHNFLRKILLCIFSCSSVFSFISSKKKCKPSNCFSGDKALIRSSRLFIKSIIKLYIFFEYHNHSRHSRLTFLLQSKYFCVSMFAAKINL